ncbi:hypothetical protein [Micromonospora sp. NPDC047134]|uniref:hypothetical protein n=1 Tax=Micromonospora sp. NPDC047134 TaxID=3154340 RepID=UPI0033DA0846
MSSTASAPGESVPSTPGGYVGVRRAYDTVAQDYAAHLAAVGLREMGRMVRPARTAERDDQAALLASAGPT